VSLQRSARGYQQAYLQSISLRSIVFDLSVYFDEKQSAESVFIRCEGLTPTLPFRTIYGKSLILLIRMALPYCDEQGLFICVQK
jgi:hypothetical protein